MRANLGLVRLRLSSLTPRFGPLGAEVEIRPGDREILNPLFVVLRDRRALLHSSVGRHPNMPYVTESIKRIRDELTSTLQQLGLDSEAHVWIEKLRAACREYLTATESIGRGEEDWADVQPALAQLRDAFLQAANHAAAYYRIPAARELADEMTRNPDIEARPPVAQTPVTPRYSGEPEDLLSTIDQMLERLAAMKSGPLRSVNAGIYTELLRAAKQARPDDPVLATLSAPSETAMSGIYNITLEEAQAGLTLMRFALLEPHHTSNPDLRPSA